MSKSKTAKSKIASANNAKNVRHAPQPAIPSAAEEPNGTFYLVVNQDFELTLDPRTDLPFPTLSAAQKTAEEWMKDENEEVDFVEIVQVVAIGQVKHDISWSK